MDAIINGTNTEKIARNAERIAVLEANGRADRHRYNRVDKELDDVGIIARSNQGILRVAFIAGGILIAVIAALSPVLKVIFLEAVK